MTKAYPMPEDVRVAQIDAAPGAALYGKWELQKRWAHRDGKLHWDHLYIGSTYHAYDTAAEAREAWNREAARIGERDSVSARVDKVCRAYQTREEIERDGFRPGWGGAPVKIGDLAVVYGQGAWRRMVVARVTPTMVHGFFTTPTALARGGGETIAGHGHRTGRHTDLYVPA
jgi:hypothetical protein